MTRRSVATAAAAVLGIAVSVSLAWAASQLAGQRVGLSSEPLAVATGLAPHVPSTPRRTSTRQGDDRTRAARRPRPAGSGTSAAQSPAPSTATPPPAAIPTGPPTPPRSAATAAATPPASSTARETRASAPSTGSAPRPGHHGDGGDQRDD
jgi:hypothetical protein